MTASTKVQWRVQVRKSAAHKWKNKGLFETRSTARHDALVKRAEFGMRNTRVVRRGEE